MRRWVAFILALGLIALGLWLSAGLGMPQLLLFGAGLVGLVGVCTETFLDQPSNPELRTHNQAFFLWSAPSLLVVAGLWLVQLLPIEFLPYVAASMTTATAFLLVGLNIGLKPDSQHY
ncbi:MAG: hypothetical protein ACOX87_10310, partial [Chloroflexota bacterium]